MSDLNVRFRTTMGDIGPFHFTPATTVAGLKDRLLSEWPKGMLAAVGCNMTLCAVCVAAS
jgi:hypothetical protein